jgi:hypothetical protein
MFSANQLVAESKLETGKKSLDVKQRFFQQWQNKYKITLITGCRNVDDRIIMNDK